MTVTWYLAFKAILEMGLNGNMLAQFAGSECNISAIRTKPGQGIQYAWSRFPWKQAAVGHSSDSPLLPPLEIGCSQLPDIVFQVKWINLLIAGNTSRRIVLIPTKITWQSFDRLLLGPNI